MADDHSHRSDDLAAPAAPASDIERRVQALEALLVEKGLTTPEAIDAVADLFATHVGPMNGARAVARAWVDAEFKARLLDDGPAALAELGIGGPEGNIVVVENTPDVHNVVVCTLCSCYPWPVLGLPPNWYKCPAYRARMVREPRAVLAEMGCAVPTTADVRVWDASAERRYMVLPERPGGTEGHTEEQLASLVTRDSMIGVQRL